jgi:hypothetical protein
MKERFDALASQIFFRSLLDLLHSVIDKDFDHMDDIGVGHVLVFDQ